MSRCLPNSFGLYIDLHNSPVALFFHLIRRNANSFQQILAYSAKISIDIVIGIPLYGNTKRLKICITLGIGISVFGHLMLCAINFYHQLFRCDIKISDIIADRSLSVYSNRQYFQKIIP